MGDERGLPCGAAPAAISSASLSDGAFRPHRSPENDQEGSGRMGYWQSGGFPENECLGAKPDAVEWARTSTNPQPPVPPISPLARRPNQRKCLRSKEKIRFLNRRPPVRVRLGALSFNDHSRPRPRPGAAAPWPLSADRFAN